MRTVILLVSVFLCVTTGTAWAQQQAGDQGEAILKELRRLNERLDTIDEQLQAIGTRLETIEADRASQPPEPADDNNGWGLFERFGPAVGEKGADPRALAKISLPRNPTREDVERYVNEIMEASRGQNSFSSTDPQPRMLARIGPEHVDVLFEHMGAMGDFYVELALDSLIRPEHRDMVIENLPIYPQLVKLVLQWGWEDEAADVLIAELANAPGAMPAEWARAVANLDDPSNYPLLIDHMVHSQDPAGVYEAIEFLPGIDLADGVGRAWRRARGNPPWVSLRMAEIAVGYGHLDALSKLIDQLTTDNPWGFGDDGSTRRTILRHIDFRGTDDEIDRWFHQNQTRLIFDPESRKFMLPRVGLRPLGRVEAGTLSA